MSTPKEPSPQGAGERPPPGQPEADDEPGTNAVEHEPDPKARPIPDGEHRYVRRSPYTTGND